MVNKDEYIKGRSTSLHVIADHKWTERLANGGKIDVIVKL